MPVTHKPNVHYPLSLLDKGDSFFVPTVDPVATMRFVKKRAEALGIQVSSKSGIDTATGLYGVRVIRV
jgi:hypothetical protein